MVQVFSRAVHSLHSKILPLQQRDVWREVGGLDACGESRVLNDTQRPLGNTVRLRDLRVGETFDAIRPRNFPQIISQYFSTIEGPINTSEGTPSARTSAKGVLKV